MANDGHSSQFLSPATKKREKEERNVIFQQGSNWSNVWYWPQINSCNQRTPHRTSSLENAKRWP